MKVTGTYVWSATVEIEIADGASDKEQRNALDNAALTVELDWAHPILHDCSNKDLID